jgi:hypothetical protein
VSRLQDYDPTVIEVAARRLYEKATASLFVSIVAGASLGAAFGAVPLTPLGEAWPIPSTFGPATMLLGALAGAAIGYVVGDNRAFRHRLQAQAMLTDLQRELNTAATVDALRQIVNQLTTEFGPSREREAQASVASIPETVLPAPAPAPAPAPVAAPAPAAAVLVTVPPASPEPTPIFALPQPALSPQPPAPSPEPDFAPTDPVVAERLAFPPLERLPEPAPEPAPQPEAFALPEPVAFPQPEEPPVHAPEFTPPLSADSR